MAHARYGGAGSNDYGGGFMGGSPSGSQGTPGGGKTLATTLRPVTIRQLLDATQPHPEAELNISGVETGNVTFVAQIHNISRLPTNISMAMEDGTGSIDVRQWAQQNDVTTDDDQEAPDALREREWVRVVGSVKTFNHKRNVNAMKIRKVTDFNEINYHMLDAIRVTLYHERGGPPGGAKTNGGAAGHDATSYVQGGAAPMDVDQFSHFPPLQRKIIMAIVNAQQGDTEGTGLRVDLIAAAVSAPLAKVEEQLGVLTTDGHVYNTVDDDHYAATAATS